MSKGNGINYELLEEMFKDEQYNEIIDKVIRLLETELEEEFRLKLEEMLGRTYFCKSEYSQAIEYNLYALDRAKKLDNLSICAKANFNLISAFGRIGDSAKALYYAKNALSLYNQLKDSTKIAHTHNSLGVTYAEMNELKLAEYHFVKALEGTMYMPEGYGITIALNLGSLQINKKNYEAAIEIFEKYLPDVERLKNMRLASYTYKDLARAYEGVCRYEEAQTMLYKALEIQTLIEDKFEQGECYKQLSSIAQQQEEYKLAFDYLKRYKELEDQLMDEENRVKLEQLEKRIEAREKLAYLKQNKLLKQVNQELREANEQIKLLAKYDSLTGVYNRRGFIEYTDQCELHSIILLDVDNFKQINDTYGHQAGDEILIIIASCIKALLKDQGSIGRWGGEEFIIVVPTSQLNQVINLAKTIKRQLNEEPRFTVKFNFKPTVTMGISCSEPKRSLNDHIIVADKLLYQGKRSGKNTIKY